MFFTSFNSLLIYYTTTSRFFRDVVTYDQKVVITQTASHFPPLTRTMMGEYVLYYGGKVVGGIYDNRLLVKPTPSAVVLMPEAPRELPYEGAKEMLLVEDIDNRGFLNKLFEMMYEELPEPKRKK